MTKTNLEHCLPTLLSEKFKRPVCAIAKRTLAIDCLVATTCDECQKKVLEWLAQPYQEPKYQLTLFAKSILEHAARCHFKYMAWSLGHGLHVYVNEPCYEPRTRTWEEGGAKECITLFLDFFPFMDVNDRKAYSIQEILDNCEVIEK